MELEGNMSWYRKIDVRMYGDRRFRALSRPQPNGQTLWTYILTGPHTSDGLPGLYPCSRYDLADRLGWEIEDFMRVWRELEASGDAQTMPLAIADWHARVLLVPNAIRYNPPESPNVCRGWAKPFDLIPECSLRDAWACITQRHLHRIGAPYVKGFREAFGKAFPEGLPEGLPEGFREAFAKALLNPQPQPQPQPQEESPPELPMEAPAARPALLLMPVKDGEVGITQEHVNEWTQLYGNIDVMASLRRMRGHWLAKPLSHRKTRRGIMTSINTWLGKDSDRAGGRSTESDPRHSNRERNKRRMMED